jgi:hypothetical protein
MRKTKLGWTEPVSQLESLRTAVGILAMRSGRTFRPRMDDATLVIHRWGVDDFPERIRPIAKRVFSVRRAVRHDYQTDTLFHFERLTRRERHALITDIIGMYEACLLDLGKIGGYYASSVYPKDRLHKRNSARSPMRSRGAAAT